MQDPLDPHDRQSRHAALYYDHHQPTVALEIVRGRARRRVRPVDVPAFLIGSAVDCDLVLGDPRFPEVHAYVLLQNGEVSIRQLGFLPEITLNGQRFTKTMLTDGDRIRTGPFEFRVHIASPSGSGRPPRPRHRGFFEQSTPDASRASTVNDPWSGLESLRHMDAASLRLYVEGEAPPQAAHPPDSGFAQKDGPCARQA
ncbi:MAG: FHA domain-containing protein [Pirellulales bacterium]